MKRTCFIVLLSAVFMSVMGQGTIGTNRTIFAYGGALTKPFIKYVIALTKKENPRICFLPTASGDNANAISAWYDACEDLPMKPYVQRVFINSAPNQKTFEENLLSMDAIIVGGGSTLNMMAIWKAQGIDTILRKAYDKGIVMAGGSAGSLCWFQSGYSDSRPKHLSIVNGLDFINASHCPHYHSEPMRKPLYLDAILKGELAPGYACDDMAGIVFENERYLKTVALNDTNNAWYITVINGKIDEKLLPVTEIIK